MDNTQLYKRVMRAYEADRRKAADIAEKRRAKLYEAIPRVQEIDARLANRAVEAVRMALAEEPGEAGRLGMAALIAEKQALIKEHGFPAGYITEVYGCPDCRDTGFVGDKKCQCLIRRLIEAYYSASNVVGAVQEENFDTFDLRYYADEPGGGGLSPLANIQAILTACMDFTQSFGAGNYKNLLFYGDTGLGKTFLCNCVAKELLDAGKSVLYVTAPQMFKKIEDLRFNRVAAEDSHSPMELLYDAQLLVIDDLGSEFSTVVTNTELFGIVNGRHLARRPTVISTNLAPSDLQAHYSDRIASRFFGHYVMMRFFGDDIRLKKKLSHLKILK